MLPFTHLLSSTQLTTDILQSVFTVTEEMEGMIATQGRSSTLSNKVIALLFYEPSSRTMLSFQSAVQRLGAGMLLAQGPEASSMKKGESLEDTIRMVMGYADAIVLRHPEEGSAERAAAVSTVPVINAGDGGNEHPTQALIDLFSVQKEVGRLNNLRVAAGCDPQQSRTVRSFVRTLSQYENNHFTLISPSTLGAGADLLGTLEENGATYTQTEKLEDALDADVLYMNRLQEERFEDPALFESLRTQYILTREMVEGTPLKVFSPLPRIYEIETGVDDLPNAAYFRQAQHGVPIRMALLSMMLTR